METSGEKKRKSSYRDSAENGYPQFNLKPVHRPDVKMQMTQILHGSKNLLSKQLPDFEAFIDEGNWDL